MKYLLSIISIMIILLMAVSVFAQDVVIPVTPATQAFSFPGLNLQGDTLYFPTLGVFAAGIGTDIATFYDILSIRAEATVVSQENSANMAGVGLGINIPKLVEKAGGTWLLKGFTSSIGVLGMVSFTAPVKVHPAFYVTILKVVF